MNDDFDCHECVPGKMHRLVFGIMKTDEECYCSSRRHVEKIHNGREIPILELLLVLYIQKVII